MRTTVTFDDDVAAALARLREERGVGVSEAVNELIRKGLLGDSAAKNTRFVQRTTRLGLRVDVSNIAEALEVLEGSQSR